MSMENQHRRITGYRDLTAAEIALMNDIKSHAIATEALLDRVKVHVSAQFEACTPSYKEPVTPADFAVGTDRSETPEEAERKDDEKLRLNQCEPFRWQSVAKTHLQQGLMALTRAVAQPTTF